MRRAPSSTDSVDDCCGHRGLHVGLLLQSRKVPHGIPSRYRDLVERTTWPGSGVDGLIDRALSLMDSKPGRSLLGLAGAPAAGKSTLAGLLLLELQRRRPGEVVGVGMDAFHIGHRVLERRGLTGIKGAPETFDAVGFIHLLQRIRTETGPIYAPEFAREIEDSLAHVTEIDDRVRLVIVEGQLPAAGHGAVERRPTDARRGLVRAPGRRRAAAPDDAAA